MISMPCRWTKKLAPFQIYFGAILEKIMRQIENLLARVFQPFWRHVFQKFGS
ncbi:hypothetical protein C7382_12510 [Porphyromonas loveana]|uniref:Uncharacterized protein n=1 Tax=Porphyromonas loveana TaxID=1884669 RepID=A0A2U1F0Q4_9PORP|nr:hypothetical protein C7382_12510 [Porphyromonas loveana]